MRLRGFSHDFRLEREAAEAETAGPRARHRLRSIGYPPHGGGFAACRESWLAFIIDETLEIAAPAGTVWEVLTEFARYGEWNPFVVECASTLEVGAPIEMRVRVFESFAQTQRETVFEHVPGERLCYGLAGDALGALASRRSHEVRARDDRSALYRSHFELSGWLAPLVRTLLGRKLERGFHDMTVAVGSRAQALASEPAAAANA